MFPNPMWPYLRLFDDDQRIIGLDEATATALSGDTYADKVKAIFGNSLIDYRRLNEGSGTSALDSSPKAHAAGTISGATWTPGAGFDGGPALLFDGVNDYTDIYSAALNTDFNGQLFTISTWIKVANAGVWTDATGRFAIRLLVDANNSLQFSRPTTNNLLRVQVTAGSVQKVVDTNCSGSLSWLHFAVTFNLSADQMIVYFNGARSGSIQTGVGTWVGALSSTQSVIGANNNSGASSFSGYIRDVAIGNTALSASQIAQLAVQ